MSELGNGKLVYEEDGQIKTARGRCEENDGLFYVYPDGSENPIIVSRSLIKKFVPERADKKR